ncbi:MAG: HD-GYP domain-containing protein [Chloroflexota bacterium]
MKTPAQTLPWQPGIAIGAGVTAFIALALAWALQATLRLELSMVLLIPCLFAALIITYHFPIHVGPSSKLYVSGIALYLMAVLIPPVLAASIIGVGILAGEFSVRQRTGNHRVASIIPTQGARWILVGLAASLVAHSLPFGPLPLLAAGTVMWLGDILTGPLLLSPVLNENPIRIITMMIREGGSVEAVQYAVGFLGALEAVTAPWSLALLIPPAVLIYIACKRARESESETRRVFEDIAGAVDERIPGLGGHSRRVSELTSEMLAIIGAESSDRNTIVFAARVHDIGKMGVPDALLRKCSSLTPAEADVMRSHVEKGVSLLRSYARFRRCAGVVLHHHEEWDGGGFPEGLHGTEIPFGSRVIAVADAYDNLTNDRPHALRISPVQAVQVLRDLRDKRFDPECVDALVEVVQEQLEMPRIPQLRLVGSAAAELDRERYTS